MNAEQLLIKQVTEYNIGIIVDECTKSLRGQWDSMSMLNKPAFNMDFDVYCNYYLSAMIVDYIKYNYSLISFNYDTTTAQG